MPMLINPTRLITSWIFKSNIDASTNPNYPSAVVGDIYRISVAGKIGGASGISVDIGDAAYCIADNAGGTQAAVGGSWGILQANVVNAVSGAGSSVTDSDIVIYSGTTGNAIKGSSKQLSNIDFINEEQTISGKKYFTGLLNGVGTISPLTKFNVADTITSFPRGVLSSQYNDGTDGSIIGFSKSRGTVVSPTIVNSGDTLGRLVFSGYDGSNYIESASIDSICSGTIASTRVASSMTFSTGTNAAPTVLTERMRIDSSGNVSIGTIYSAGLLYVSASGTNMATFERASQITDSAFVSTRLLSTKTTDMGDGFGTTLSFNIRDDAGIINPISEIGAVRAGADNTGDIIFKTISTGVSNERMRIDNSGNVGIGTNAPTFKLEVNGTAKFTTSIDVGSVSHGLSFTSSSPNQNLNINAPGRSGNWAGNLIFNTSFNTTSLSERLRITSLGNIGVNTTTPLTRFNVAETVTTSPRGILSSQFSDSTDGARIGFSKSRGTVASPTVITSGDMLGRLMFRGYDGTNYIETSSIDSGSSGTIASTRVASYLAFSTGTDAAPTVLTERMRIDNTGNVGIGTNAPSYLLDVNHTYTGLIRIYGGSTTAVARRAILMLESADTVRALGVLTKQNTSEGWFFGQGYGMSSSFSIGYGASQAEYAAQSKFYINTSGNVGIGTTSPSGIFHSYTTGALSTTSIFERASQTTDSLFSGLRSLATKTTDMGDGFGAAIGFNIKDDAAVINQIAEIGAVRAGADNTGDIIFKPYTSGSGNERMRITNTGNVGIGVISPSNNLSFSGQVAQTIAMERHTTSNTAGNNITIKSGGATISATDKDSGSINLIPGENTGTGKTSINLYSYDRASSTGTSDNSSIPRFIIPSVFNLTNNTNCDIFEVALPSNACAGGELCYSVAVSDGTDFQVSDSCVRYAIINKGGAYTSELIVNEPAENFTAGTLTTDTVTFVSGTNKMTLRVKFISSLTPTSMKFTFILKNNSMQSITLL